jgi:ATP-binding cassette subfamily B protein
MMDLTRIQSAEDFEVARQRRNFTDLRITSGYMAWLSAAYVLTQRTTVAICGITILIVGGKAIAMGYMTLGGLLSFFAVVVLLKSHLQMISSSIPQIIEGNESLTTIYNLLVTKDSRPYSGTKKIAFTGHITLEAVRFRYSDRPILRDINLTIPQGTLVALVGPNGAGKTTIANLILGFYRPQNGQLYADDHPFAELDMVDLRRHMGVVTQDPIIFPATISDNISYGHVDTRFEEIVHASKRATAHEFIQTLPQGYDTFVGENGLLLSGGQRQRIALARALLRRPKLMLLDEPTNHLDEATARKLMENLKKLDEGPAILLITQDMNIVHKAHYLYVLHARGYIVASGDPATDVQNSMLVEAS